MRAVAAAFVAALVAAGCGTGSVDVAFDEPSPTLFADDVTVETAETTTTAPRVGVAELDLDLLPEPSLGAPGVVLIDGIAAPVVTETAEEWTVATPCAGERSGRLPSAETALVVLDPAGDAGRDGELTVVERNHTLALSVQRRLLDAGITAIVTRGPADDLLASYRSAAAEATGARVVVSFALVDGEGTLGPSAALELVHPAADSDGRRLAGLVHAAVRPVLDGAEVAWPDDVAPGVRAVLNQRGTDFFTLLRGDSNAARVVLHLPVDPAVGSGLPLADSSDVDALAGGVADAIARYLVTDDEGDGFVETAEVVRNAPTANGTEVCLDPLAVDDE